MRVVEKLADNLAKDSENTVSLNLTDEEKTAVIAFLHTLTDQVFVTAQRFANPFHSEEPR